MRWKITIEYDGTHYNGWQKQDGLPTIQGEIEKALLSIFEVPVETIVAGRTDAGVHAAAQVAHFDLANTKNLDGYGIAKALNAFLCTKHIAILDAQNVQNDFHARFSATNKLYRYRILNRLAPPALDKNVWHIRAPLDADTMHESAQKLLGKHDFTSYRDKECQAKTPIRHMKRLDISRHGDMVIFEAEAQSFLHHQIRNFIGTFVQVGMCKEDVDYPKRVLDARDRSLAGVTAPPQGLVLVRVEYP